MKCRFLCGVIIIFQATALFAQKLVIKDQRELRVEQGKSITIGLGDLTVEADKDHNYPNGFYLEIDEGDNYSVNGSTVTPHQDFVGKLKVKIRLTNGDKKSDKFNLEIEVVRSGGQGGGDNDGGDDDDDDGGDDGDNGGDDDDDDNNGGGKDNGGDNDGGNGGGSGKANQQPEIINQVAVEINQGQRFNIQLTHLVVADPDNKYPEDFKLKVESGNNYTVSGTTITPASQFVGTLSVKVKVNDGKADSERYDFQIVVKEVVSPNVEPVITAHASLSTFKDVSITLRLIDLSVTDPDNNYPSDFKLTILDGADYTVSGHTIEPASGFVGTLPVKVKVNDGQDDSNIFEVRINIVERGKLQILGQVPIIIAEDSSYPLKLADLNVSDPSDTYPSGFRLTSLPGDNYVLDGNTIKPAKDFHGDLIVPVKIGQAGSSSDVFEVLIIVQPLNDPPSFSNFDSARIAITVNATDISISNEVTTADIDNERLAFAEIELDSADNLTVLGYSSTSNIRGVFDQTNGILIFLGDATLEEYNHALQTVTYSSTDSTRKERLITFRLNDGQAYSKRYLKKLVISASELTLDIPTAFTPNNDNVNDTWEIRLLQRNERSIIDLKIYNRQGQMVFTSNSFELRWDGKLNGEILPADSYFYTLEITNGIKSERRQGTVTILR